MPDAEITALADALQHDWRTAQVEPRVAAMLAWAEKLTLRPAEMQASDLDPLREAGLSDEDILGLCLVVSYYAFANRLADGLGLALEPHLD